MTSPVGAQARSAVCTDLASFSPYAGGKASSLKTRVMITYIVEKGKPLASPA